MMVVVGISSMISYSIFAAMSISNVQTQVTDLKMAIEDSSREGLYKMAQEIRQSAAGQVTITTPAAGFEVIQFNIPPTSAVPPYLPLVNTNPADAIEDYTVDWNGADADVTNNPVTIQYARGGVNCDRVIRTQCAGGCPAATCPNNNPTDVLAANQRLIAVDAANLDFDNTTDPDIVVISISTQRTLQAKGSSNLMKNTAGASAPLLMTAKAELRNN